MKAKYKYLRPHEGLGFKSSRHPLIDAILVETTGIDFDFLNRFTTTELRTYLKRLTSLSLTAGV